MINYIKKIYKAVLRERTRNNIIFSIQKAKSFQYKGDNYSCNCCNRNFKKFLPFGIMKRENALCPYCFSLERTRLLLFYLQNELHINDKKIKLLHFAPEKVLEDRFKKMVNLEYLSVDLNPELAMQKEDITNLTFLANSFDLIICSHVLMHVPDEPKGLSEIYRVLRPGGIALIQTHITSGLSETLKKPSSLNASELNFWHSEPEIFWKHGQDFADRLNKMGFQAKEVLYGKTLGKELIEKYCLGSGERESIFHCVKPS